MAFGLGKTTKTVGAVSSGDGAPESGVDAEALRQTLRASRRGAGARERQREDAELRAELDQLFEAEQWEEIAALYFEARFAITGFEGFRLTDKQKKSLGATMAMTMRVLLKIDPAYIAIVVFSVNFGGLIASKETQWYNERKKRSKA